MQMTRSEEDALVRSVKRASYAGLDSITLRRELSHRVARMIPREAHAFSTTDPDSGLLTHSVAEGLTFDFVRVYLSTFYPDEDAVKTLDLARTGEVVSTSNSDAYWAMIGEAGLEHELHTIFPVAGGLWGSWCMLREKGARGFGEREQRFMRRIAPHVARGLKAAALIDAAAASSPTDSSHTANAGASQPGVVVLDSRARFTLRSAAALNYLKDLQDVGLETGQTPFAVASAFVQLREQYTRAALDGEVTELSAALRVRGRSGCWYTLHASLAEPDASGEASTVVVIEYAQRREIAPVLTRLYGLSPREREVLALVMQGESTKRIAAQLGLSVYTVQEHLDRASEKVGVRGRKALVAKLFFDGHAPRLLG